MSPKSLIFLFLEAIDFSAVKHLFTAKRKVLVTSHSNPDGDALGSALAMYHFLTALNHEVHVMVPNDFPDFLSWLPGISHVLTYEKNRKACDDLFNTSDILFALDYNAPSRINDAAASFIASAATKILIDHHIEPDLSAFDHCFTTTQISSTSELVYQFILNMAPEKLDREAAENIYVGIMTDTGSFSFNCNYGSTFLAAAKLISKGVDANAINRRIYSNNSESRIRLLGYSLSKRLTVIPGFHTAYIALTRDDLDTHDHKTGDTEGLVNYALSITGIRFAALFTERENKIRISFRSAGEFNVNEFARKHFQGGGHRNAAGGDSFAGMDETLERFNRLLADYKEDLS